MRCAQLTAIHVTEGLLAAAFIGRLPRSVLPAAVARDLFVTEYMGLNMAPSDGAARGAAVRPSNCTVSHCHCHCALSLYKRAETVPAHKHSFPVLSVTLRRNLFLHNWFDLEEEKEWLLCKFMSAG